jgi:hypothetical protein
MHIHTNKHTYIYAYIHTYISVDLFHHGTLLRGQFASARPADAANA